MTPTKDRVLAHLFMGQLGDDRWNEGFRAWLTPQAALTALKPLCAMFDPHLDSIAAVPYAARHERSADRALQAMVTSGQWSLQGLPPAVCRVLLERHGQCLQLLIAQMLADQSQAVQVPVRLPEQHHTAAVVMQLAYRMRLPYPVCDRTGISWPEGLAEPTAA